MVTFDAVKELVLELPEVEVALLWDMPALKVRNKLFARLRDEGDVLVVKIDRHEREALIQSQPDTFFVTPHYQNYPYVLVRLDEVERDELRELLIEAWRMTAPKRLVAAHDSETGPGV